MCGEVRVPEEHLDVCRVCNAFGQNCGVVGSSQPGPGINNADFVFYISAMETERCQKGMTVAYAAHCQQEAALDRWARQVKSNQCIPQHSPVRPQEAEQIKCFHNGYCYRLTGWLVLW